MEGKLVSYSAIPFTPAVSVLMCVFNERAAYLEQAILSILNQTFADFEFVILDDGSDRNETIETLEQFAARDHRVRLFREPRRGLTKSLNIGLSRCRGELVCRHDSDDWSEPERLARQTEFLKANPEIAIVGSYVRYRQENGNVLWVVELPSTPHEVKRWLPITSPFAHGAVCFRRNAMAAVGGYREELPCSQDYDCFWRLCDRFSGTNIPAVLYNYRYTGVSISARRWYDQARVGLAARKLADARRKGEPEDIQSALQEADAHFQHIDRNYPALLREMDHIILAGYYRKGLLTGLRGLRSHPFTIRGWLKLARGVLFWAFPPIRKRLFSSGRV